MFLKLVNNYYMAIINILKKNYPLAFLSTYQIGGPAEFFVAVKTKTDLLEAVKWAQLKNIPITILGGGSNILINDQGVKGLVIKLDNDVCYLEDTMLISGARCDVKKISELAWENNLSGIEWSIGIPGSMGGAIRGNAGAHGGSFDTNVTTVEIFNSKTLEFNIVQNQDCGFKYRHSIFKDDSNLIIWEVSLQLKAGDREKMKKEMDDYREYRRTSQPNEPSAGCVFKNLLVKDIEKINPQVIEMAETDGKIRGGKIGAGYLIEKLGLSGYQVGGAMISSKHANFIPNINSATAADVQKIMNHIREKIREVYGLDLEPEVQLIGFN